MNVGTANNSSSDSARHRQIAAPSKQFLSRIKLLSAIGFFWTISLSGQIALIPGANAQNASCNASFNYTWSDNTLGQDPCTVATYLGGVCNPGFSIPSISNPTEFYGGPALGESNMCQCSTVYYMLLSACSGCQGGEVIPWSTYSVNCTTVYPSIFIGNIPSETKVPHWAYLNIIIDETFNETQAQLVGDAPESTGTSIPTGTDSGAASTSSSTHTLAPAPSKKHSESGPIAGGVVGGIIFLFLCALAIIYFRRKRSRRGGRGRGKAPSSQLDLSGVDTVSRPHPTMAAHQTISSFTGTAYASMPSVTPKLYDPSDPSTFPPSMLSTSPSPPIPMRTNLGHSPQGSSETNNSMGYFSTGYHSVLPSQPADGRHGVAEV